MALDYERRTHQEWLGFVQPVGLVVSPVALVKAQAFVDRNVLAEQQRLLELVTPGEDGLRPMALAPVTTERESRPSRSSNGGAGILPALARETAPGPGVPSELASEETAPMVLDDLPRFCTELLEWAPSDLVGAPGNPPVPEELSVWLPEYRCTLTPSAAVPDPARPGQWLMLVRVEQPGADLDREISDGDRDWVASPQARFERLLREKEVPIGLISNGLELRLLYAPRGETSGYLRFPVRAMTEVAGRPILGALLMLLRARRLFGGPPEHRLPAILRDSRKYQNEVSTRLAGQVLQALHQLVGGFQSAHEAAEGQLLRDVLRDAPGEVYGGLLTSILRLVFVLYAEDRGLMPQDPVYVSNYSVGGLFEGLRADADLHPDTMDQRFGAWARCVTLFRLVHDGAWHGPMRLPPRAGKLFDPDAYPFLEGRPRGHRRRDGERLSLPRLSDGVVLRVLENLLMLDGERLSYRTLDVEQIGSVYEAMMGFELKQAAGPSIALTPDHVVVDLEEVLEAAGASRSKLLKDRAGCEIGGKAADAVRAAASVDELVAALGRKVSPVTPGVLAAGAMYLQPSDERRRSGSHYTPRSLTEPIVRATLEPVLRALGENPRPEQILEVKVCDPAMGSGAFLVEACRYLGDRLEEAWQRHRATPPIPLDEDAQLHARRMVAQRCLYGVDKNPMAGDLAKLSLWLATLARDHPFTFVDHALRHGDSLVGLTRERISGFNW